MSEIPSLEDIAEAAARELYWRLQDDRRKSDVPDHVLSKVLSDVNRVIDRRAAPENTPDDGDSYSLLKQIDGLPRERAIELLRPEVARLHVLYVQHNELLEELEHGDAATEETGVSSGEEVQAPTVPAAAAR